MAITKTTKVERIEVYPLKNSSAATDSNDKYPSIMVVYNDIIDDSEDSDLPVTATRVKHIHKFVSDGGATSSVSGEDPLVQSVAGAIWS